MAVADPHVHVAFPGRTRGGRIFTMPRRLLAGPSKGAQVALGAAGLLVIVTIIAPLIMPYSATMPVAQPLTSPSLHHLFGTDEIGRDIFSRVLLGMRSSWWGAVVVILSGLMFGGLIGLVAGAAGGAVDSALMRATDSFMALPGTVLAIAVAAATV